MALHPDALSSTTRPSARAIVFIMGDIPDVESFVAPSGAEVVMLDASADGLAQIAAALAQYPQATALHIVGHGSEGVLQLGTTQLRADNLAAHQPQLESIRASLAPGADILLYGCAIGANAAGEALLQGLADATGADIAASVDATGAAQLGGNWVLERATGSIEATSLVLADFDGLLLAPADQDFESWGGAEATKAPAVAGLSSLTLDNVAYTIDSSDTPNQRTVLVAAAADAMLHVLTGQVIIMNNGGGADVQWFEISASSLANNFKLVSMMIEDLAAGGGLRFTVTGYDGGSGTTAVASDTVDLSASDVADSITYTKNGAYNGGTLTFDATWQNVDTIRFTSANGAPIILALDNIDFEAPVGPAPTITSATYDAATGTLSVSGTNMTASATIAVSKLTLAGQGGATYTLTSPDVAASSTTAFSVTLNAADRLVANRLFSKDGLSSLDVSTYNINAASGWTSGAAADATNAVTVSNVAAPAITSATYDAATGTLVVTGTRFASKSGAANDIDPTKFTFTGQGGTYTLSASTAVEFTSDTSFTLTLGAGDKNALRTILDKNGVSSTGGTTYNLAVAEDWAPGSALLDADLTGNGITVSNITRPTLSSLTMSKGTFKIGDTATVTFTFSEAVSGFTAADVSVASGAISAPSSADGGTTWTATFTPASTTTDLTNTMTVDLTGVTNGSGYAGIGSSSSSNYIVDTERPTASIAFADTALTAGETTTVTITFSEAVTGFTNADLITPNGTLSAVSSSDGGTTWTATFTPSAGVSDTTNVITLDNTGVADARGNAGTGTTDSGNYTVQTVRPTATIVIADPALAAGETSLVTITFSEAVTGFTNADLTIANGTLSAVSSGDGGVTWTATFTPTAGISDTTNVITLDNTGVANGAGNSGTGTTNSGNYTIDTARPTATIMLSDTALKVGETALVTITFSEAVTGFDNTDLSVEGGSLGAVSSADGGTTWTATFTPTTPLEDATNAITVNLGGVADAAGNTGTGTASSGNYAIDTLRPAATSVTLGSYALKAGETTTVTIVFPEAVSGFTVADLTVGSGAVSGLSSADGGLTWTGTFTPSSSTNAATNVISLDNTGVADLAGNAGSGTTSSANYTVQTTRPTATIAIADTNLKAGETSLVTFTFSEAVSGFTNADVTVQNGTLSAPSSSDGGVTWTATFTPDADITDATNIITLDNTGVVNGGGNSGTGSTVSANYQIDTARPTATITMADSALAIGETSLVTITFSEAVTGFTNADLTVENGTLSAVSSSDGGVTWTATFTPTASVSDATNVITLDNTGVADTFGNAGTGTTASANYTIDSLRPTATVELLDNALTAGETTTLKVTFSEAVTGFTNADLTVANGTISAVSSSDGGITWTATFTPTANISDTTNVVTLNLAGVADTAGNAGSGTVDSANYTVQTTRPTAAIAIADDHLKAGETSLVTFTFSEAVTGFTSADVSVQNGSLSAPSSSDGGTTWTATFTPAADITDTTNIITLDNTGVANGAGNSGTGTTVSANYQIDTARPTATIVVADNALAIGETSTVTITFSEAVTGLTTADFTVENGTIDTLATSDNITFTATLHPTASVTDTSNLITLDNTGVLDGAGNAGTGTTASNNYAIDSQRPTATVELLDTALTAGETTTLKVTFSEAVTGFTNADLTVANGTIGPVSSSDGGITWTATFTPTANISDATNVVTLNLAGVADTAGNAGSGTVDSANYTVQTTRPTATIAIADANLKAGETSLVTFTFSEAVSGFTSADVAVQNGTLGAPSSSDGGVTWTATFTPAADITDATNVITLDNTGVVNGAGNSGTGSTVSANYQIDTARPTAAIAMADSALAIGETSLVTITFSEAVTGFTNADLTVENGTLGAVSSADGGVTWTATFTPTASVSDATNLITLDNTGVQDAAGNTGTGATVSANYTIDGQRPTATIAVAGDTLGMGGSTTVTITFSEPVTGFTDADLTIQNGTIEGLASADGGKTWTATLRPAGDTGAATNVITLNNAGVADLAGNAGAGATTSNSYAVRTDVPTATIVVADSALTHGETSLVTITFSHAVTGFTNDDLTVQNGTLSPVSSSDGGKTWTATLTPAAAIEDTTNVITLDNSSVATAAGTPGAGTSGSNNYTIDTKGPSATVTLAASTITTGASTTVTIVFNEAVAGFGIEDITVGSGTLSELASSDGGITWTAKLTTSAVAATNAVRVNLAGLADLAGNSGTGEAVSANYAVAAPDKPAGNGTVDGVPVTKETATDPGTGLNVNKITVPVVTPTRVEDPTTPNSGLADIPLGSAGANGAPGVQLSVGLPVGVGLQAEGPSAPLTNDQGLLDLIRRIESKTTSGTTVQQEMKGDGSNFLQSLGSQTQLETRTIVLNADGNAPKSVAITGAPSQPNAAVALVIDTTALPSGSVVQLNDVEFAAVVGAATLRGGAGRNYVTGDGAAQTIFLGVDDDELHGGAGDDIVGSEGGDDLVDGGEGNDIVVGGVGNDRLFGGSGNDTIAGGRSDVGQWKFRVDASGHVNASHETAVFNAGAWEAVDQSQLDASASGLRFLQASGSKLVDLALFYKAAFGRAGDLGGLEFWAGYNGSATQMMSFFMQSSEYQLTKYAGLDDAGFVRAVYTNLLGRTADSDGLAFWTGKLGAATNPLSRAEMLTHFALSAEHRQFAAVDGQLALAEGSVTRQSQWFAGSGDDRIEGGAGSDVISGGDGTDTVVYSAPLKQFRFEMAKDGTVRIHDTATGDVDTIAGIERGEFAGAALDLHFTQAKPAALQSLGMLYQVLFDRAADVAGLNWWLGLSEQTPQLVQWMLGTDEYKARYGNASDAAFVKALFDNTGLSASQAGGQAYWENYLHSHSRAEMVATLIGNADVINAQFGADGLWLV